MQQPSIKHGRSSASKLYVEGCFPIKDACAGSSLSFAERRPLRRKGLIAPLVDEGARSGEIFLVRSEQLLALTLKKGDVDVMDN